MHPNIVHKLYFQLEKPFSFQVKSVIISAIFQNTPKNDPRGHFFVFMTMGNDFKTWMYKIF